MADYSYDAYLKAKEAAGGKPIGDFSYWQRNQPGYGTTQVASDPGTGNVAGPQTYTGPVSGSGPLDGGGVSPIAPGGPGSSGTDVQLEAQRRRKLLDNGSGGDVLGHRADGKNGFEDLPPDVADIVLRDSASGRVRKARGGSTRSALMGQPFSPTAPIGRSSILGDY